MFGSPPTGNGEPEQGRGSWKVNDGVESGCRMAWRTHEEAEAAGPGCFRSAHRRKNKVQKGMRPPALLTLSAAFSPPDHNFQTPSNQEKITTTCDLYLPWEWHSLFSYCLKKKKKKLLFDQSTIILINTKTLSHDSFQGPRGPKGDTGVPGFPGLKGEQVRGAQVSG